MKSKQSSKESVKPKSTRLKLILKITAVILFVMFALEAGLRLREKLRTKVGGVYPSITYQHNQLRHALIPNVTYFDRVKINSLGFRGPEFSIQKPPNTIRIVCLGGSTTFDTYVSSNDQMWTQKLETFLKERYFDANIEVINAGVVGYKVIDTLINLQTRILPLQPDIIVLYHAHNDINGNLNTFLPTKNSPRPGWVNSEGGLKGFLRENSLLYQKSSLFLRYAQASSRGERGLRNQAISEAGLRNFERNLSLIAFSCTENNIKLIMPQVITGFRAEMTNEEQLANAKWALLFCWHLTLNGIYDAYIRYNEAIEKVAHESGAVFVESTKEIPGGSEYFADGIHFTDKGAHRFAEIIGARILDNTDRISYFPQRQNKHTASAF